MKVIWLGDEDMLPKEKNGLKEILNDDLSIIRLEVDCFPYSSDGALFILDMLIDDYLRDRYERINGVLAGIFPAHAAAAIAREIEQPAVYHSVRYPIKLENGETIFEHSHWEHLNRPKERFLYDSRKILE